MSVMIFPRKFSSSLIYLMLNCCITFQMRQVAPTFSFLSWSSQLTSWD